MLERDLLLDATAAILLAVLISRVPAVGRRMGRPGLATVVAGALLPLLDPAIAYLRTDDRIGLLSQPPLIQGPIVAVVLIGLLALLVLALGYRREAAGLAVGMTLGFAGHALMALLTEVGWPLLAPFSDERFALPVLPSGHPLLIVVLFVGAVAMLVFPRRDRWILAGTALLAGLYLLAGAVEFTALTLRTRGLASPGAVVSVYPDDPWLARWLVVVEAPDRYELRRMTAFGASPGEPKTMARWNDQPLFLKLLGDPVVNRFYFLVFHYPVVRLDISGSQITLLMQELEDQSPLVPGPTFYLESDLTGRNRFYQLQRFN